MIFPDFTGHFRNRVNSSMRNNDQTFSYTLKTTNKSFVFSSYFQSFPVKTVVFHHFWEGVSTSFLQKYFQLEKSLSKKCWMLASKNAPTELENTSLEEQQIDF